jgi:hypothetical protein
MLHWRTKTPINCAPIKEDSDLGDLSGGIYCVTLMGAALRNTYIYKKSIVDFLENKESLFWQISMPGTICLFTLLDIIAIYITFHLQSALL